MGWQDYHLWEFTADDRTYGAPDPEDASSGHKVYRASTTKLASLIDSGATTFEYTYDMGDNWEHRIVVERVEPAEAVSSFPTSAAVNGAPEDCGSVPGYYEFLDAIAGPPEKRNARLVRPPLESRRHRRNANPCRIKRIASTAADQNPATHDRRA